MTKQPTATAFAKRQQGWAEYLLEKTQQKIEAREAVLRKQDVPIELWDEDDELWSLYDDELFYERYAAEMVRQRAHLRERYL